MVTKLPLQLMDSLLGGSPMTGERPCCSPRSGPSPPSHETLSHHSYDAIEVTSRDSMCKLKK